jgi:hypothetical protein
MEKGNSKEGVEIGYPKSAVGDPIKGSRVGLHAEETAPRVTPPPKVRKHFK